MNKSNIHPINVLENKYDVDYLTNITTDHTAIRMEIIQFMQQVNHWLLIIQILMVICGVLGNGLALIVINRPSLRDTSSSVFITYLAIFDTSVLVVHITSLIKFNWKYSYILHCFLVYFTDFVTFCSVWIMVLMTIERCLAVHSPFLTRRFCTIKRARYSIYILILISSLFFSITFPFAYQVHNQQEKCLVRVQYHTLLRILKPIIFYFIPDIILLINLFIVYELFMAKRRRTQTLINPENAVHQINAAAFNRKQQQLTIMLVTVSLSFYIFTTPAIIDYIQQRNPPNHRDIKKLKGLFLRNNLTVLWLQMSSATNFIFYCLAGSKFRATCLETLQDIYDYIRFKLDDDYQRRRRYSNGVCLSSNFALEMRNGPQFGRRDQRRSTSAQQTLIYQLNNSSKRPSCDTVRGSQINSRRVSTGVCNVQEL